MSQYSFNLDNPSEVKTAKKVLNAIDPTPPVGYSNVASLDARGARELSEKVQEIGRLQKLVNEKDNKISNLEGEKEKLENDLKQEKADSVQYQIWADEAQDAKKELEKKIEELNKEIEHLSTLKGQELDAQKKQYEDQIKTLNKTITDLRRRYEPAFIDEQGEQLFFVVKVPYLERVLEEDAPYIGKLSSDNSVYFQFNPKGPMREAISKECQFIQPFCEIIEQIPNGSVIYHADWGKGKMINKVSLQVETKAKIRIL